MWIGAADPVGTQDPGVDLAPLSLGAAIAGLGNG